MLSTVLIVDDNVNNLRLLEKLLRSKGYNLLLSHNGAEALETALKTPPDLIISDILMPVMDGFTLCQHWNRDQQLKKIPFIFYTATYTDKRDEVLALSMGAARFIVKPSEPDVFLETIQSVLDEFRQNSPAPSEPVTQKGEVILSEYNQALVRKLEQKVEELKDINLALENEISQRKQTEKALHESEEKLKRVFSSIAGGIIITDLQGDVLDCNDNTYSILRRNPRDTVLGKNVYLFIDDEEKNKARANFKKTIETGVSYNNEYLITRNDGSKFPIEVCSCIAKDWAGIPLFMVISFSDITERKKLQNRILELYEHEKQQKEELQEEANARGLFIEVLAHELRTPLTPILASAGMLTDMLEKYPGSIQRKLSANIDNGAKTLVSRLEELLDLASFTRGTFKLQMQAVDISKLVREVVAEIQPVLKRNCQQIQLDVIQNPVVIEADPVRLKQVLANLLSNASKFSPQDSSITLKTKIDSGNLYTEVSDKGIGISDEEQARLFQPYHRVEQDRQKFPGIGLGLAVCKQIIEAHRGRIWVISQTGKGSTFSFVIPLKQPAQIPVE
jgi:two-component system, cell cycle sensor histidine kinase and response regulator CckA